eukprot:scaffold80812_cov21-Tisochrysis_lutea.AAC.3
MGIWRVVGHAPRHLDSPSPALHSHANHLELASPAIRESSHRDMYKIPLLHRGDFQAAGAGMAKCTKCDGTTVGLRA